MSESRRPLPGEDLVGKRPYFFNSACLIAASAAGVFFLTSLSGDGLIAFRNSYLIPWILLLFLVISVPSLHFVAKGEFDFTHPLVYPVWSYFFPAFVLGSLYFATGRYEPYFMDLVQNPEYNISLALAYVTIGFGGLSLGFFVPCAGRLGQRIARRLPALDWQPDRLIYPALLLLALGRLFELKAFTSGVIGYQQAESAPAFGNLYYSLSLLGSVATFLLWLCVFRTAKMQIRDYLILCLLVVLMPYSVMISGNKGELLRSFIAIVFAFGFSGRQCKPRHLLFGVLLILTTVLGGMTYGTLFRHIKGDESRVSLRENMDVALNTLKEIRGMSIGENLGFATERALERFETLTSLSVIVANYKQLEPLEEQYGIGQNIWTYTWTAFIPRFVWPEKPLVSDARSLAALYFNFPDNSFAITPMGDLLRNFGPIGIPFGMALLGFVLRTVYAGLVEGDRATAWKGAAYYLFMSNISFEGFYGTIFPGLLRVGVILLLGIWILQTMISLSHRFGKE